MAEPTPRCWLLTSFNAGNLAAYLENDETMPALSPVTGETGQVIPLLMQAGSAEHPAPEFAFVWVQPEKVFPSFQKVLEHHEISTLELFAEADPFAAAIMHAAGNLKAVFVATLVADSSNRGLGMTDLRPGGMAHALLKLNARLIEKLAAAPNVFVLDAQRWLATAGAQAFAHKLWYQAKVPFHNAVFQAAVADLKAAVHGLLGGARKLVIVDLDETLWGGVAGEVGWENVRVGGHDPNGEAFADFQRALKALTRRGIVLAIVSKNDEAVAMEALRRHPEMQLRPEDFAAWRINWRDKAENIRDLLQELNLGAQSAVFIDDHPVERARVREAFPEILVPEWPENPQLFPSTVRALGCFDTPHLTAEDVTRAASYATERSRTELKQQLPSLEHWLQSLQTVVAIAPLHAGNLARATQLLNKTNQLNLRTRRLTEAELRAWADAPGHHCWVFRVSDRFGDSGLTGLASLEVCDGTANVVDFVLSCRVMGRRIEEAMTHWLVKKAKELAAASIAAEWLPTEKNSPCRAYWQRSGFAESGDTFKWLAAKEFPAPNGLTINNESETSP